MATKRTIATSIINELNLPFDHELFERIKDRVVALRAKYLRQSIGKYGIDELLQQTYVLDMVRKKDEDGCIYYESECAVAMPIRAIGSAAPFKYVGTIGYKPFTFLRIYETATIPSIPINAKHAYYSIENRKVKTYNTTPTQIKIIDIFEDFDELIEICANANCVDDDSPLPMPADFTDLIIKDLVSEFSQAKQVETIKVED